MGGFFGYPPNIAQAPPGGLSSLFSLSPPVSSPVNMLSALAGGQTGERPRDPREVQVQGQPKVDVPLFASPGDLIRGNINNRFLDALLGRPRRGDPLDPRQQPMA